MGAPKAALAMDTVLLVFASAKAISWVLIAARRRALEAHPAAIMARAKMARASETTNGAVKCVRRRSVLEVAATMVFAVARSAYADKGTLASSVRSKLALTHAATRAFAKTDIVSATRAGVASIAL